MNTGNDTCAINDPIDALNRVWLGAALPIEEMSQVILTGADPVMPSSFAIGSAAQISIAAAALGASLIGQQRGQDVGVVSVALREALLECTGFFSLDGVTPQVWDPIAGLYACGPGSDTHPGSHEWVRLHTNFAHHRDGVLKLLGLPVGSTTPREAVGRALQSWTSKGFEQAATEAGLVVAAARSFDEWDAHPQAQCLLAQPLIRFERIGDADPLPWPDLPSATTPLNGLRMLDLTRILAGPVCGRTLARYGADVMLVNSPNLPNIASIADTSRGKRSTFIDLQESSGRTDLLRLVKDAHVFIQGYRPGSLAALGFDPLTVARHRPGIVYVSLSAYGDEGPWAEKRGFDSLVQTATGFNLAEAQAAGVVEPRAMPVQILDYATGFLMAFATQAALYRQANFGGSWHVRLSLARTGLWLRSLGRIADGFTASKPDIASFTETSESGFGKLLAMRHAARFAGRELAASNLKPAMPPGSHSPQW
jgi:hypothetical protein